MSRLAKAAKEFSTQEKTRKDLHTDEIVTNFMGGDSYKLNPLETLKLMAASAIFGEAQYYRPNKKDYASSRFVELVSQQYKLFEECGGVSIITSRMQSTKSTSVLFEEAIDAALDYDFEGTLQLAVDIRKTYNMRLNPQIIMVRAAIHPKRKEFTEENPGMFNAFQQQVMSRADEPATQLAYYLYLNRGKKNQLPSILKRSIAFKLGKLTKYQVNKYKNAEIGMINAVRLTHATSPVLDELMKTGKVDVPEEDKTWEQLRSGGMSWEDIVDKGVMPHMAMLRNIRNVFKEVDDLGFCKRYMDKLKDGVLRGKQFPFRYESAYRVIAETYDIHHKPIILDALNDCIDLSINNMPMLKGVTACLSDNSGSAWGTVTSEYGTATVANIDNLSSVIAAKCSDEGYVYKFGDRYIEFPVSKRDGALGIAANISARQTHDVGGGTEGGIWIFFNNAIEKEVWYDNIFIFSDMQAGTGGLYGTPDQHRMYHGVYDIDGTRHINVFKLVMEYRKRVNPRVNVFSVQTAGYDNVVIPPMAYRCAILTGWTGKEIVFADAFIKQWDEIEESHTRKKVNESAKEIISDKQYTDESIVNAINIDDESKQEAFNKLTEDMSPIGAMALKSLLNAYAKMSDEERKKFFEDIDK